MQRHTRKYLLTSVLFSTCLVGCGSDTLPDYDGDDPDDSSYPCLFDEGCGEGGGSNGIPGQIGGGGQPTGAGGAAFYPGGVGGSATHPNGVGGSETYPDGIGGSETYPDGIGGSETYPDSMGGAGPTHPMGDGPCERTYSFCFEQTLETCSNVDECQEGQDECLADYDECTATDEPCDDEASSCFLAAESCSDQLGNIALCRDHYTFCVSLAQACAE